MNPRSIDRTALIDRRAGVLNQLDDLINTAAEQGRDLTDAEQAEHDHAVVRYDELTALIGDGRNASQSGGFAVPNVNFGSPSPATASRSLDELLWATAEAVPAGTIDRNGEFRPDPSGARNPVEQVVIRNKAGRGDGTIAPRLSEFPADNRAAVRSFQKTVADMATFGLLLDKRASSSAEGFEVARSHPLYQDRWAHICRALDVDTSGEGGTWVPTGIGATMHEKVRAMGKIAPLFMRFDLPTNPWKFPVEGADAVAHRRGPPTADPAPKVGASTPGTVAPTFDAEICGARTLFSRSLEADSAAAITPFVQGKLIKAFSIAEEQTILDGDTDGTHQDSDVQAIGTIDARTAWDGLRKRALAETAQSTTTTTAANLSLLQKAMGLWGADPADLAFIIGVSSWHALRTDSNLLTVDKMGPNALLLNGQIGSLWGVPVVVSQYVREDLNASGVYDGITTTKTYALCVNRAEWAMGQRMALDIEVDDSIYRESFQRVMVGFSRTDFQALSAASTDDTTSVGYNITTGS